MTPVAVLAQPFTLPNGVVVKNRLLKSAMSEALGTRDGAPYARTDAAVWCLGRGRDWPVRDRQRDD
jgi:2,4-dienoyl-CoA reductase-like NADH-dependent reductase (Old Yellow Enzyme family)